MKLLLVVFAIAVGCVSAQSRTIYVPVGTVIGATGYVTPDGRNVQYTDAEVDLVVLRGSSGVVTASGRNYQFTIPRSKRSAAATFLRVPVGSVFGPSGYITPKGEGHQFTREQAENILFAGPSGLITKDGRNVQFHREKRSAPAKTIVGASGLITPDGQNIQLKSAGVTIALEGPSAYILSDGTLIQKKPAPAPAGPAVTLAGESGMITPDGQHIQFKSAGVHVILEGPSAYILSDGTLIQKRF